MSPTSRPELKPPDAGRSCQQADRRIRRTASPGTARSTAPSWQDTCARSARRVRRNPSSERTLSLQVGSHGEAAMEGEQSPAGCQRLRSNEDLTPPPVAGSAHRPGREAVASGEPVQTRRADQASDPCRWHAHGKAGGLGVNRRMKPGHGRPVSARLRRPRTFARCGTNRSTAVRHQAPCAPSIAGRRQPAVRLGPVQFAATGASSGFAFQ
jgi:hypothetical protein